MNVQKITAGTLVALTGVALTAVVAANPFATQASSQQVAETTQPQAVEHLQAVEDEDADQDAQTKPYIGIAISPLSPARAEELGVDGGAAVTAVLGVGPSNGVLERGDVITSINGQAVNGPQDVIEAVMASSVGDVISVIVTRGDDSLVLSITVGETEISKRGVFQRHAPRMPDLAQGIIQQALQAGDRFARGEAVIADEDGNYQTYRAAAGTVTEVDADAGTFTLQPKDGSDPISYTISDDTRISLNRQGDLGELNTEDNTLVVDVDGEVKLVHQGDLPMPNMLGKGRAIGPGFDIRIHRGPVGPQGRVGPGGIGGLRQGGQPGFGQGFGNFNQSGLLDRIQDRVPFFGGNGGPGDLSGFLPPQLLERLDQLGPEGLGHDGFLTRICEELDTDNLPDNIVIRCEASGEAPTVPPVDDNSL